MSEVRCFMVELVMLESGRIEYGPSIEGCRYPRYRRVDTSEKLPDGRLPPGAMWWAWQPEMRGEEIYLCEKQSMYPNGPDGRSLAVILPDGQVWFIDSIAGNCTWKDKPHNCWSRSGTPPNVSVGVGPPCCGGAGSIKTPTYHGHLVYGVFTA
jgi:hypothetical protein